LTATIQKKGFRFKKIIDRIHFSLTDKTMCLASKDFKFCTCEAESTSDLTHFWKLHRFNKDKNLHIMGDIIMLDNYINPYYGPNEKTFLKRLNKNDAFDKEILLKEEDTLVLVLNNNSENSMTFCFKYTKGKWKKTFCDWLGLKSYFDIHEFGVIQNLVK